MPSSSNSTPGCEHGRYAGYVQSERSLVPLASMTNFLRDALEQVQDRPRDAEGLARSALAAANPSPDDEVLAWWLLGRALHELDQVSDARSALATAHSMADQIGDRSLAAEIAISEAVCVMIDGSVDEAMLLLDEAERGLSGAPLARLVMQRGLIELHRGNMRTALEHLNSAEPGLLAVSDNVALCRLLINRGVVHTTLNSFGPAAEDLESAQRLSQTLSQQLLAGMAAHNLGYVQTRRGNIPAALTWFDEAQSHYDDAGSAPRLQVALGIDSSSVLLSAGLIDEAADAAKKSVEAARSSGNQVTLGDALLQLALVELSDAQSLRAILAAEEASDLFTRTGREPLRALSDYLSLRGRIEIDSAIPALDDARDIIAGLEASGWLNEAQGARIALGRAAVESGDLELADQMLSVAAGARRSGPWLLRVGGWYAEALRRFAAGDLSGTRRALRAGCRIVEDHQATLTASDLRATITAHSSDLIDFGVRVAHQSGSARHLLDWSERLHARSMRLTPVRPPRDGAIAALLEELRSAHVSALESAMEGDMSADTAERITRLEADVRHATRTAATDAPLSRPTGVRIDPSKAFRTHTLIEFVGVGGDLVAVSAGDEVVRAQDLGPQDRAVEIQQHAIAALTRLAFNRGSAASRAAARRSLDDAASELDELLFASIDLPDARPVVLVPAPPMRAMPWSLLSTLRSRPWVLAPSGSIWSRRRSEPLGVVHALLVAGPGLEHADAEVQRLADVYSDVTVLSSTDSNVRTVLDEMGRADVVHVAAHGRHRTDSPLFSSLQLADGPLTVYDIEQLGTTPHTVVLSACDAGRVATHGGELLGTGAALLHLGVSAVIAPVTAISDEAATPLMLDLHRHLAARHDPATALRLAQNTAVERADDREFSAAASFVTLAADCSIPFAS